MVAADRVDVYASLAEANPDALVADGFEDAYIGHTLGRGPIVAVYDYEKCVSVLIQRDGMTRDRAEEYLDFNTISAYVGEFTPLYISPR